MKKILLVITLIFSVFAASAQTTLLGKVVDGDKKVGVGYATVALLRDTVIVSAVAARSDGTFSLDTKEQGEMVLEVRRHGAAGGREKGGWWKTVYGVCIGRGEVRTAEIL